MSRATRLERVCWQFERPLVPARLIRRYKRFLADVELEDGRRVTVHCPNSGSMAGCMEPGGRIMLSPADNPNRRTPYTWEMSLMNGGWVGINTQLPNKLAAMAAEAQALKVFFGAREVQSEVSVGNHTRLDLLVQRKSGPLYVEVKNVTLVDGKVARFPDAVTSRGAKHLETLMQLLEQGFETAMLYVVQRGDASGFAPAHDIDPTYAQTFERAQRAGVKMLVVQAHVRPERICLRRQLPLKS